MMISDEAEAQGHLTRIFRDEMEIRRLGLWEYGAMGAEVKAVVCKRRKGCTGECKSNLGFSKIEAGQWQALKRVRGDGKPLAYKISDSGIGYKPFDMVVMWKVPGVFIFVWSCTGVSRYYLIDSVDCEALREATGKRGSFSEAWARGKAGIRRGEL